MNIEKIAIGKLKQNPKNPREISPPELKKLTQSIKEFPKMMQLRPIIVNRQMQILSGNMRFLACQNLKWKTVPCVVADLSPAEQEKLLLKDNSHWGDWDFKILGDEYSKLELQTWASLYSEAELQIARKILGKESKELRFTILIEFSNDDYNKAKALIPQLKSRKIDPSAVIAKGLRAWRRK
jgi:ParB-like chromosome segregation protein Spo0J